MQRNITEIFVVGTIIAIFTGTPALADRDPTPEERIQVEAALQYLGFTSYDDIDFDEDGYWEIEDARDADGQEYDLDSFCSSSGDIAASIFCTALRASTISLSETYIAIYPSGAS